MINFISAIEELGFGDALIILLLGMVVIFITLAVLIGCLMIIQRVVVSIEGQKKVAQPQVENKVVVPVENQEDEETVAAITAAIACILQEEAKGEEIIAPFKIKKIRHIH